MWTRSELEIVDRVATKHDLLVITDEIYEYIRYDGREHISPATVGSLAERTVTIMGLSRPSLLRGGGSDTLSLRAYGPAITGQRSLRLYQRRYNTVLQRVFVPKSYFVDLRPLAKETRSLLWHTDQIGFTPIIPEGAYYVLVISISLGITTRKLQQCKSE